MAPTLLELNDISKERWRNDYDVNKSLRRAMRGQRKEIAENKAETKAAGLPEHMRLLPSTDEDAEAARAAFRSRATTGQNIFDRNRSEKRAAIRSSSIFSGAAVAATAGRVAGGGGRGGASGGRSSSSSVSGYKKHRVSGGSSGSGGSGGSGGGGGGFGGFGAAFGGGAAGGGRPNSAAAAARLLAARRTAASAASNQSRAMKLVKRRIESGAGVRNVKQKR